MSYFEHISEIADLKSEFRRLAMEHHPDRGGDTATMQAINAAYETAVKRILSGQGKNEAEIDEQVEIEAEFRERIETIINLDGITIEICGRWIWVTGGTYPHRQALKDAGFWWASKKFAWYWHPSDSKTAGRGKFSLNEIRQKYGSTEIDWESRRTLSH